MTVTEWDRVDVRRALAWLERGQPARAAALLAVGPGEAAPTTAGGRLARALARTLAPVPRERADDPHHLAPGKPDAEVEGVPAGDDARDVPAASDPARTSESDLGAAADVLGHLEAATAALRSGRTETLVRETRDALERLPPSLPWITLRCGSLLQACYRFTGEAAHRRRALSLVAPVADAVRTPHLAVSARAMLGSVHLLAGDLHAALDRCDAALALAHASGLEDTPIAAPAHQFRGYVLVEWNRMEEADASLQRAWAAAGPDGRATRSGVARVLAELATVQGDRDRAAAWLALLEEIVAEPMTLRNREWLAAVRIAAGPGSADPLEARDWLARYGYSASSIVAMAPRDRTARLHELTRVLDLLEAAGRWTELGAVADALAATSGEERRWFGVRAWGAAAVASEGLNRPSEADARMAKALDLGAPGSFARAYLGPSHHRITVLARQLEGPRADEARRVLEACPALAARRPGSEVTPRQREVLERVALGASNKSIARELGVSVSTVRTHLRALFGYLGATSRTQAVARARARGMLGD